MENFPKRLEHCAQVVGSKVKLAEGAGVSFSQLMRYINGSSVPTIPKLVALAEAARVTPAWLLSGDTTALQNKSQVVLEKDIFLEVISRVDQMLQNSMRTISPKRKSTYIFALCKAVEQAQQADQEFLLSERSLQEMLDFMAAYTDDELHDLYKAIENLSHESNDAKILHWQKLISRGGQQAYDTPSGKCYFARMDDVEGPYALELKRVLAKAEAMNARIESILDVGCGNGRHLKYIHQHYPQYALSGVDASEAAVALCKQVEDSGDLPKGTASLADMQKLPYADNSFDVVISRYALMCCPLTPNHKGGMDAALFEIYRVLKPGGMLHCMTRKGKGISFYSAHQLLQEEDVQMLAKRHGFDIVGMRSGDLNIDLHQAKEDEVHLSISDYIKFQFIKPL